MNNIMHGVRYARFIFQKNLVDVWFEQTLIVSMSFCVTINDDDNEFISEKIYQLTADDES